MASTRRAQEPLTRERILDAAMALVSSEGLSALSMRRLATELDTGAMSLYNHVPDKASLLEGLACRVLDEVTLPASGEPRQLVAGWAVRLRRTVLDHRPLIPVVVSTRRSEGLVSVGRLLIDSLIAAGVDSGQALRITQVVGRFVAGSVLFDGAAGRRGRSGRDLDDTFHAGIEVLLDGFGL